MSQGSLGAFVLDRPLAQGGMAQVWAATHRRSGIGVSIKVITGERAHDPYFRSAFMNEVRAVAGLDHPGVVLVLDYGIVPEEGAGELGPGCPYLVMEPASQGTLHEGRRRALVWPEIRTILLSLLGALGHAHAHGVIHRDLKPGNVLVCGADDPRPGLKLTDFGLARHLEDHDRPGSVEAVRGTLHYMAPEQCHGLWRDQGPWTDLYALGCIAYQLATGRPPFKGLKGEDLMRAHVQAEAPPLPPRRGLPEGYADWVRRLLRKPPTERFQRAADAAWALSRLPEPEDVGPTRWIFPVLAHSQGLSDDLETDPTPRTPLPEDLEPGPGEPTVRRQPVRGGTLATPALGARHRGDAPPIPPSWREPQAPSPDLRLVDAGLGLFDLRPLSLVGRDAERDHLWSVLRAVCRTGRTRCALLVGSHGHGTSRVASWLGSRAHEVGAAHVFLARHGPAEPPLRPLRRMLGRAMSAAGLSRLETRVRIQRFAERHGLDPDDAEDLVAFLKPEGLTRVDTPAARYALISRVLACFARDRPVVLRVEDLQWGGETTGLIAFLLDQPPERQLPILVVATHRIDSDTPLGHERLALLQERRGTTVLSPGPLPPADMQTLVQGRMRLSSDLALRVLEVCRGNPLFAVQLVADWAQRGLLVPGSDGFELRRGAAVQIPDDLHQAWDARVSHALTELPRRAEIQLERAAVLGEEFDRPRWAAVCALDDPPQGEQIRSDLVDALLDHQLLRLERRRARFTHTLLRECVLRRAREAGRLEDHHYACAQVLDALRADPDHTGPRWRLAEAVGRHRYAAGDRRGALDPLLEAAEAWRAAGGHRESLALVGLAEAIVAEIGVPLNDPRQVKVVHLRVACHHRRGDAAETRAWVDRALALAEGLHDPAGRALLRLDAVRWLMAVEQWDRAAALVEQVRADLTQVEDPELGLRAAFVEGHLARGQGRLEEAAWWLDEAWRIARDMGDVSSQGNALRDLGVIAWLRQDVREAQRLYTQARDVLADGGGLKDLAAALNNLGECHRVLGDMDAAERTYRASATLFTRAGASAAAPYPSVNLALVLIRTGRHQEALGPLARALEEVQRQENRAFEAVIRTLIAPCCAALGDWAGWARQLDRLEELGVAPSAVEPEMADAVRAGAEIALQAQRSQEALRGWALAATLYRQLGKDEAADACERARVAVEDACG